MHSLSQGRKKPPHGSIWPEWGLCSNPTWPHPWASALAPVTGSWDRKKVCPQDAGHWPSPSYIIPPHHNTLFPALYQRVFMCHFLSSLVPREWSSPTFLSPFISFLQERKLPSPRAVVLICGPWTSSISMAWEPFRNAKPRTLHQAHK